MLSVSELQQVVGELGALAGAVVQKAWAPLPQLVYLELRHARTSVFLCLSAEPEVGRLSVARDRFPSPPVPPSFQNRLRAELTGARLQRVSAHGHQALLTFDREGRGFE